MKVLVIEDNDRLRKSILDYIHDDGLAADGACDGEEGFYKAANWDYDVVILDIMMPKMDGWQVLQQLRESGSDVPVIMLTARDALEDRVQGLDNGADDYLVKPFEMEELIARIRAAIRRSGGQPQPKLEVGPITLNTSRRTAMLKGRAVELTAREYSLLEILAFRQDAVVTRDEIYEKLFDERDETMSNMLDVYIYKLRQKFGKEHIVTRRGMGYQLVA
ncbi:MAG: response regulator transcription factor [Verrucomicrobiota bacterium]